MADYPVINGFAYSWASVAIKLDGADQVFITEISYSHTVERSKIRGAGMRPLGETRGEYEAEGSITMRKEGWRDLVSRLGDGYMERRFSISVSYAEEGQAVTTDELIGCRFSSVENTASNGTDPLDVSLELSIQEIRENGRSPLRSTRK